MALNASNIKQESKFERPDPLEPGSYPARVVQVLSLGLQPQRPYQGEEKPPKPELYVTYEMLDEFLLDEDGEDIEDKPRWISERIPLNSLDSDLAKSTKRYLALDPELKYGGDWAQLGGTPCMVTIVNSKAKSGKHAGKIFDRVGSVSTMRAKEAKKARELINPAKIFDIDEPDMEVFGSLPQWLQDVMTKENLEFGGSKLEELLEKGEGKKKESKKDEPKADEPEAEEEEDEDEDW